MNLKVGTNYISPVEQLTISTSIYAANDVVGGLLTFDLSASVRGAINGGILNSAHITDDDDVQAALTLYLFDTAPTTIADQVAFTPTKADLEKRIRVIDFLSYTSINSVAFSDSIDINQAFFGNTIYGYPVCTATPTWTAATDLSIKLSVLLG